MPVHDQNAPVIGRKAQHELRGKCIVRAEHGTHQAPFAAPRELDTFVDGGVRNDGAHRPERFDGMNRAGARRIALWPFLAPLAARPLARLEG